MRAVVFNFISKTGEHARVTVNNTPSLEQATSDALAAIIEKWGPDQVTSWTTMVFKH